MKFIKGLLIIFCLLLLNPANAAKISRVVILDSTIPEAEEILTDVVDSYKGVVEFRDVDKEKHIYTANYYKLTIASLFGWGLNKKNDNSRFIYGTYSCGFKMLPNNKDVLCTCRKQCMQLDYIFSHYKKFYNELKFNGKQVIPYNKYMKGNYTRN